jgi:hypothetical protein
MEWPLLGQLALIDDPVLLQELIDRLVEEELVTRPSLGPEVVLTLAGAQRAEAMLEREEQDEDLVGGNARVILLAAEIAGLEPIVRELRLLVDSDAVDELVADDQADVEAQVRTIEAQL